jgi:hypothetical protein
VRERTSMPEKPSAPISRREFARRAAIASAVASIAPASAVTAELVSTGRQTPASPAASSSSGPHTDGPPQSPPNMPRLSPESQAEADSRFQAILAQYPSRFSDEQKTDLRRLCVMAQPPLDRLRAYAVENGDGPGLYLKPLFEREKKPKAPTQSPVKTPGAVTKP